MKHFIRNCASVFLLTLVMVGASGLFSQPAAAQSREPAERICGGILTLPPWYRGLTDDNCNILSPTEVGGLSPFIWTIALNVIEMLMQVVGYIAVGFLIFGGFKYMTAQGEASKIVQAKDTIRNALIGLLIAIFSVAIVNFAAGAIS